MQTNNIYLLEKEPLTANAAWSFNLDRLENWAYIDKLFSPEECVKIIEIGEKKILKKASITDNKLLDESRDSKISWLYAIDDMDWVYRRVTDAVMSLNSQYFKFDLFGFTEGFQFTRYDAPSGFYGMHIDKLLNGVVRKLSLTIQLSDSNSYDGGELSLQFSKNPDIMPKDQGKMIVFPSYVLHEVKPVTQGTRYSLVAWISGTPFK
jgi:PKHD-type hydroxylase